VIAKILQAASTGAGEGVLRAFSRLRDLGQGHAPGGANGERNGAVDSEERPSHEAPLPSGDTNQNPAGIGLLALLAEDFATYERNPLDPAFLAVALHRLGNARMDLKPKLVRAPFSAAYRVAFTGVNWLWGIDLAYTVRLGRRVRIWHHGGMVLGARSIGDDVHIRHNTTLGLMNRHEPTKKPIIGDRVDIGVGACIFGAVTVGADTVIGANSVVVRDLPPGSTVFGVPARPVNIKANESVVQAGDSARRGGGTGTPG
jgi:serine O-acetyltransferase